MAYKKPHDLKKVTGTINDIPVDGLVSVSGEYDNPQFSIATGTNGARQVKNNDLSGTITVTLNQHSTMHTRLMALYSSDVSFPIVFIDKTTSLTAPAKLFGDECRLESPPTWGREAEETDVEYVFKVVNLSITHGVPADA